MAVYLRTSATNLFTSARITVVLVVVPDGGIAVVAAILLQNLLLVDNAVALTVHRTLLPSVRSSASPIPPPCGRKPARPSRTRCCICPRIAHIGVQYEAVNPMLPCILQQLVHLIVKVQGCIIVVRPCRTVVQCEHLIRLFIHFGLLFRSRKTGP